MTARDVHLRMRDGIELAATIYVPDGDDPQPCLLEALPYRKDDLTSSYTATYERLCDEFGFAVCRVDLRGTGSSEGDATDEYPKAEQEDLKEVIAWLAAQPWCNGKVGMFGTSYSGFNSLQLACERPPALKAVCAIYATDDRWTDDVHYRGGALKLVDLVDYNHYMTPMCALPPVPAVYGAGWREEWRRRIDTMEPWVLTWLRASMDGEYWRHGSVRRADGTGYERIEAATMIVAGWADGYRNNSFRTIAALKANGTPHRLLAGPWAHADPKTAMPGPRIDLDVEMAAFFDHWLRGDGEPDRVDVFVRGSTRPEPDLDLHEGFWTTTTTSRAETHTLDGPRSLDVQPDVGTAAWIDCAGHLPWGQSGDQRADDARSLTWEWPADGLTLMGHPTATLRLTADATHGTLSVKLCDVFPDGTSALVTRGSRCLTFRDHVHGEATHVVPDEEVTVDLELDACAYRFAPGHRLRVSVAGADWPNTVAPPAPVTLTVQGGEVTLPVWDGEPADPGFTPGAETSSEDPAGTTWTISDDVLARTTTCHVDHGSDYAVPHEGHAWEHYTGTVSVDRRTFAQRADAACTYRLTWPGVDVRVHSTMQVELGREWTDVTIDLEAYDGEVQVARRQWTERFPR
ncbi:CocE/NonD family hydrolase [Nocardioides caldifontis]|uniref:CocE/NonD family hydrolase n=1 Tax=Nocardioides caldifontis TaxID=2588938 RepID=UPI0011E04027|nr:CocE/NonD family hydrolase [Nocardioides caldifontis]